MWKKSVFSKTLSLSFVRVCNFQCHAGNFDSVSHRAIAGDVNAWFVRDVFFQCNAADMTGQSVQTAKKEISSEISETVGGSSVSMWSGQRKGHGGTV